MIEWMEDKKKNYVNTSVWWQKIRESLLKIFFFLFLVFFNVCESETLIIIFRLLPAKSVPEPV